MYLGELIRLRREEKGFDSQEKLAKAAGVTRACISLIETGRTHRPNAENAHRIAKLLDLDPGSLAEGRYQAITSPITAAEISEGIQLFVQLLLSPHWADFLARLRTEAQRGWGIDPATRFAPFDPKGKKP